MLQGEGIDQHVVQEDLSRYGLYEMEEKYQ